MWSHETGEELSLYPYISKEVGNCVKTTGGGDQLAEYPWYRFCNNTQLSSVNSVIEDNVMEE